jgi:tetratricopeptide (TPR) repeat protein
MRGALWLVLGGLCAVALRDAACEEELSCQEAARRGAPSAERVCRDQYFAERDPDDGLLLARALVARGELGGAAAISQGLLPTTARPDALSLLAKVALAEGRPEEAMRALELAAEQHLKVARRREAAAELFELGSLRAGRGEAAAARTALERSMELAVQLGDAELRARGAAALARVNAQGEPGAQMKVAVPKGEAMGGSGGRRLPSVLDADLEL